MKKYCTECRGNGISYKQYKEERLTVLVILRRNCLLKHVIEGKIEERIKLTERPGRRRKQILDDLKEQGGY
jgi:hypothetical protein